MGKIRVVDYNQLPWLYRSDGHAGEMVEVEPPGANGGARFPHPGSETELYLHEARAKPNAVIEAHVHRTDEIIYVTEGELHLGSRVLTPGCSVYIPGDTLYSFKAGPTGLTFLNFRGRRDTSHLSKDEFLKERAERKLADHDQEEEQFTT